MQELRVGDSMYSNHLEGIVGIDMKPLLFIRSITPTEEGAVRGDGDESGKIRGLSV